VQRHWLSRQHPGQRGCDWQLMLIAAAAAAAAASYDDTASTAQQYGSSIYAHKYSVARHFIAHVRAPAVK